MTRQELCEKYNLSEDAVKNKLGRTKQKLLKEYNLILTKTGRGEKADYQVTFAEGGDRRASTMLKEEKRDIMIAENSFSTLLDFNFMVFLAICTTPMGTFYGSYEDFLNYVEVKKSKYNLDNLKEALTMLSAAKYINYTVSFIFIKYFIYKYFIFIEYIISKY